MTEILRVPAEQRKPRQEKEERAIASVVYDSMSASWKDVEFEQVNHQAMQEKWREVFDASTSVFRDVSSAKKQKEIYARQIIEQMIEQVPMILNGIDEDDWGEVIEQCTVAFPDDAVAILKKGLEVIPHKNEWQWDRITLARKLIEYDWSQFDFIESQSFTKTELVTMLIRVARDQSINVFKLMESVGFALSEDDVHASLRFFAGLTIDYAEHVKLSSDELKVFLHRFPEMEKTRLRSHFRVPEPRMDEMEVVENPYAKKYPIDVPRMRELADRLSQAVENMNPHAASLMEKRRRQEQVLFSSITHVAKLGRKTFADPAYVYFEGETELAIYKPQASDTLDVEQFPPGTYAQREWLAYQIDQALQIGTTPVTVLRDGPQGVGSVQEWKIAKCAAFVESPEQKANPLQLEDLVFDDAVKYNHDRHYGNFLIGLDGEVITIDQSFILSEDPDDDFIDCWPAIEFVGKQPSKRVLDRIEQFRWSEEIQDTLRACFDAALGEKSEICWNKFLRGLEQLVPSDGTSGRYPPM